MRNAIFTLLLLLAGFSSESYAGRAAVSCKMHFSTGSNSFSAEDLARVREWSATGGEIDPDIPA